MSDRDFVMNTEKLREAVEWFDSLPPWQLDNPDQRVVTAFEAARLLLHIRENAQSPLRTRRLVDDGRRNERL